MVTMKTPPQQLVALAETLADHQGVTHWAISTRLMGRGDFFAKLAAGADTRTSTYTRILGQFAAIWPGDLDWPAEVPRPAPEPAPKRTGSAA